MEFPSDVYSSPITPPYDGSLQEAKPKVRVMQMKRTRSGKSQKGKEKKFQCNVCGLKFGRNPDMNRHKSSVHDKRRPFKCTWPGCKSAFNQRTAFTNHQNTHTGEKPWMCGICHTSFAEQSSCARHQREQHTGLTHFCPYCNSTNKRASEFLNHLLVSHGIEKKSVDTSKYKLPENISLEALEDMPQFKGKNGIAIRRSHGPSRARGAAANAVQPVVVISDVEHEHQETPFYEASRTPPSFQTTPASTLYTISPSPSFQEVKGEGYSPQASPYVHARANALGMEFGQAPWSNLHPISRTSSAASFLGDLGDSRPPTINRPSSAPGFAPGCYTPHLPLVHGGMDQKVFNPHTTAGSPYMAHSRPPVYYPTSQAHHAPYAYPDQPQANVQSEEQIHQYLPGGLGISHTIRSRAHFKPWSSHESFN